MSFCEPSCRSLWNPLTSPSRQLPSNILLRALNPVVALSGYVIAWGAVQTGYDHPLYQRLNSYIQQDGIRSDVGIFRSVPSSLGSDGGRIFSWDGVHYHHMVRHQLKV